MPKRDGFPISFTAMTNHRGLFHLTINQAEAETIKQIYRWYLEEGYGTAKIANMLNESGLRTKRGCKWSQNAICRILTNELYTGKIINGKQEVSDFLTGQRRAKDEAEWCVVERPELESLMMYPLRRCRKLCESETMPSTWGMNARATSICFLR